MIKKPTIGYSLAIGILCMVISGKSQANSVYCGEDLLSTARWGIRYAVTDNTQPVGELMVLRQADKHSTVLYNPQRQIGEWWRLADPQRPTFVRIFSKEQRRIDYTTGDLRTLHVEVNTQDIGTLGAASIRSHLQRYQPAQGCHQDVTYYRGTYQGKQYQLAWFEPLAIPLSLTVSIADKQRSWQAVGAIRQQEIAPMMAHWQQFQRTDYADIGDNENDPFLAKLIHQGFVEHPAQHYHAGHH